MDLKVIGLIGQKLMTAYWFLDKTVRNLVEDEGYRIAAEASFYLIFSIFPLLFIIFSTIGFVDFFYPNSRLIADLYDVTATHVPEFTLETVSTNLKGMIEEYRGRDILLATLLFLWPASNVFYAYIDAVGTAYGVSSNRGYWQSRVLAVGLLFGSGFIIFTTAIVFSVLPLIVRWIGSYAFSELPLLMFELIRYSGAFLLITPCIGLIYYYGPDLEDRTEHVIWPGAVFATVLWILFSQLFGIYLTYVDTYRALYGTLGGAMLLLLWMYLVSMAVVFGAEFNYTWRRNSHT